jgi:hypothetical protein
MSLFVKKSLSHLMGDSHDSEKGLKRTLSSGALVALGIGAIIEQVCSRGQPPQQQLTQVQLLRLVLLSRQ